MTVRQLTRATRWAPLAAVLALSLATCGDDDDPGGDAAGSAATTGEASTTAPATTEPPAPSGTPTTVAADTTAEVTSTPTTSAPTTARSTGGSTGELTGEAGDVAAVYRTVFDSAVPADDKIGLIEDGEALLATIESYAAAGEAVGGIQLEPSAVTIDGTTAAVTYDVLFAGTAVYEDLAGSVVNDGGWKVTREGFCGFMAQARNPCP